MEQPKLNTEEEAKKQKILELLKSNKPEDKLKAIELFFEENSSKKIDIFSEEFNGRQDFFQLIGGTDAETIYQKLEEIKEQMKGNK